MAQRLVNLAVVIAALAVAGCGRVDSRLSTPKSAARTLFQAMYDNDLATAKSCVIAGPGQTELVEGVTRMMFAMRETMNAAYKRYGDEFSKMAGGSLDMAHIDPKMIDQGTESIDGDSATVVLSGGKTTLRLVREKASWKVDLAKSFAAQANMSDPLMRKVITGMFSAMTRAADQTKMEIDAGKYPSARPAVQAMLSNMKNAIEEEKARQTRNLAPR